MKQPLINILIRTHARPEYFKRCIASIAAQNYDNLRVIINCETARDEDYVRKTCFWIPFKCLPIFYSGPAIPRNCTAPYNLYLNQMLEHTEEGWILILDDDDTLAPDTLSFIASQILDKEHCLVLTRMAWPNGRVIPEDKFFGEPPARKHIGMPCFLLHTDLKHHLEFDGMKAGDFRALKNLFRKVAYRFPIDHIVVFVGNTGNNGQPNDLPA